MPITAKKILIHSIRKEKLCAIVATQSMQLKYDNFA